MKTERGGEGSGLIRAPVLGIALVLLCALATGCGNLTAGGATGEASVYVVGDDPEAAGSPMAPGAPSSGSSPSRISSHGLDDDPEGELELDFHLHLVARDGRSVPLTTEEARIRIDFPGTQEREVVTRSVPADDYALLRVTFTEIEAEVDAGLVVEGDTIRGLVDVELEDDSLVVERPVDLDLGEDARAALVVDMNAGAWLTAVTPDPLDPDRAVVAGDVVAEAIRVRRK